MTGQIFGLPYIAHAIPIFNDCNNVVGAAVVVESVDTQDSLREMAGELSQAISMLASTTEEISAQSQEITTVSSKLAEVSVDSLSRVQETGQVLGIIRNIAS